MERITVFCGANIGTKSIFSEIAETLGQFLASKNLTLVYGGGQAGLMGILARSALKHNGQVIGVIPKNFDHIEIKQEGVQEMIITQDMAERKTKMLALGDAFITLPGGFGTLDELFEVLTMIQIGNCQKPCGILNIDHFYNPLLQFLESCETHCFVKKPLETLHVADTIDSLFQKLQSHINAPPTTPRTVFEKYNLSNTIQTET